MISQNIDLLYDLKVYNEFIFLDNFSLNSWINEEDQPDHNSDNEFDPSSDDDIISMSDDSDDGQNSQNDSSDDEIPDVLQDDEDINDNDVDNRDEDKEDDEEEEDEVVAAFISASTERNRNHPPNLSVGSALIGGLSFHPSTNVLALGLSNGDISMYVHFSFKLKLV